MTHTLYLLKKSIEICVRMSSTPASLSFKGAKVHAHTISSLESAFLLVSTKNADSGQHSGQMSAHVRTQRSNECACSSHARAILARVGMGSIISIGTSKRQNGGRFKFRGICFQLAGIRWRQNS